MVDPRNRLPKNVPIPWQAGKHIIERIDFGHYRAKKPDRIYDIALTDIGGPKPWRVIEADETSGRVLATRTASSLDEAAHVALDAPDTPVPVED